MNVFLRTLLKKIRGNIAADLTAYFCEKCHAKITASGKVNYCYHWQSGVNYLWGQRS